MKGWMIWTVVIWGVAGAAYLWWYIDGPSTETSPPKPPGPRPSSIHRVVFAHPGMCSRDVGNTNSSIRVCHVTTRTDSPWGGREVKNYTEVTDRASGNSRWDYDREPMGDCIEWAGVHPEEVEVYNN